MSEEVPGTEIRIEPDDEVVRNSDGHIMYLKKTFSEFSSDGCRSLIQGVIYMATNALEEFDKAETDADRLDITGGLVFALQKAAEVNLEALRHWHQSMNMEDLANTINEEVKNLLGEEIDIRNMSEDDSKALLDKVIKKATLRDLTEN